ncbi:phenazine biosynthesis protein phzE [Microbacterium endophyticum]|uniref:anthranilate synthase n=1 Tax=Microbacterium endophyticum TaxID=1526412 RepID=A0A7W4V344_9MICO|nr:chorismate-binding protein [Microbacterium endophyticum]MBB2976003.1 phenazine biosynthesis protein phzE [Microbacterium endophyticum]NIK35078.1 phenazine biosynthesis protein phzE [Microbacterium endophyticum]
MTDDVSSATGIALLERLRAAASDQPLVLLAREGGDVEVLTGAVVDVDALADIPLLDASGTPQEVLALVPYRQVRERGFECHDDGAPLRCVVVGERALITREDALGALPTREIALTGAGFDIPDAEYADIVRRVIADEIGRGEGANFVIRRDFTARIDSSELEAALTWFRALLSQERGAYWTFLIATDGHIAVGASPEAHVSARDGVVTMNPISGTFRHPVGGATAETLTEFLESTKETEELFMVVDEELKMMSAVCSDGGRITGPRLKEMSRLTHTEYVLEGHSTLDPRAILRETMFAPTVTGSPMQNACTVITRHERGPRGYYSGVAALFTPREHVADGESTHDLDAPILIRTAYLVDGTLRVPVGATLVRHSDPMGEVSETHGKAAGVLGAIGAIARDEPAVDPDAPALDRPPLAEDPAIAQLLASRNARLAAFWLEPQGSGVEGPFIGLSAVVVDAEDRFTTMLTHQLRHLGLDARIVPWNEVTEEQLDAADIVVAGPGPGDPRDANSARMERMREIVARRVEQRRPLLAVCLSHQILAHLLGIELAPLAHPHQGLQLEVDVFGQKASIGFYNTFTAHVEPGTTSTSRASVSADTRSGDVYALRGPGFASVQGHLESILSRDGMRTLQQLIADALHPAEA